MNTPHQSRHTLFFRRDEAVEAARKRPGWREFHRVCGRHGIYFDDIEAVAKRQGYRAIAFELDDSSPKQWVNPVEGRGADPVAAVADAYAKQGKGVPETDAALAVLLRGEVLPAHVEIDHLLGIADEDEDLIG